MNNKKTFTEDWEKEYSFWFDSESGVVVEKHSDIIKGDHIQIPIKIFIKKLLKEKEAYIGKQKREAYMLGYKEATNAVVKEVVGMIGKDFPPTEKTVKPKWHREERDNRIEGMNAVKSSLRNKIKDRYKIEEKEDKLPSKPTEDAPTTDTETHYACIPAMEKLGGRVTCCVCDKHKCGEEKE